MFSQKTNNSHDMMKRLKKIGVDFLVFKWIGDLRYGDKKAKPFSKSYIHTHDKTNIPAINVRDYNDLKMVLGEKPEIKDVFIDELHFFPGIYPLIQESISKGYRFYGTGLPRSFNRKCFNDVPKLMCLADVVNMHHAVCIKCGHPASENQRMKKINGKIVMAENSDPLVMPGGAKNKKDKYFYEARCLSDWELPGEPDLEFKLEKFVWK